MKQKFFILLAAACLFAFASSCDNVYSAKNGYAAWSCDLRGTKWEVVFPGTTCIKATSKSNESEESVTRDVSLVLEVRDLLEFSNKANNDGLYQFTKTRFITYKPILESYEAGTDEHGNKINFFFITNSWIISELNSTPYKIQQGFVYKNFPTSDRVYEDSKDVVDVWIGKNQRGEIVYYPKAYTHSSIKYSFDTCTKTVGTTTEYIGDPKVLEEITTSDPAYPETIISPYKYPAASPNFYSLLNEDTLVWRDITYTRVKENN